MSVHGYSGSPIRTSSPAHPACPFLPSSHMYSCEGLRVALLDATGPTSTEEDFYDEAEDSDSISPLEASETSDTPDAESDAIGHSNGALPQTWSDTLENASTGRSKGTMDGYTR